MVRIRPTRRVKATVKGNLINIGGKTYKTDGKITNSLINMLILRYLRDIARDKKVGRDKGGYVRRMRNVYRQARNKKERSKKEEIDREKLALEREKLAFEKDLRKEALQQKAKQDQLLRVSNSYYAFINNNLGKLEEDERDEYKRLLEPYVSKMRSRAIEEGDVQDIKAIAERAQRSIQSSAASSRQASRRVVGRPIRVVDEEAKASNRSEDEEEEEESKEEKGESKGDMGGSGETKLSEANRRFLKTTDPEKKRLISLWHKNFKDTKEFNNVVDFACDKLECKTKAKLMTLLKNFLGYRSKRGELNGRILMKYSIYLADRGEMPPKEFIDALRMIRKGKKVVYKQLKQKDEDAGLYENQITNGMKGYGKRYWGTVARDEIPDIKPGRTTTGGFIINLDKRGKSGSHWCAIFINKGVKPSVCWYDPFATLMPEDIKKDIKVLLDDIDPYIFFKLKENNVVHQKANTDNCGFHCMNFLMNMFEGKTYKQATGYDDLVKYSQANQREEEIERLKKLPKFKFIEKDGSEEK
jgi:hypothetical protein